MALLKEKYDKAQPIPEQNSNEHKENPQLTLNYPEESKNSDADFNNRKRMECQRKSEIDYLDNIDMGDISKAIEEEAHSQGEETDDDISDSDSEQERNKIIKKRTVRKKPKKLKRSKPKIVVESKSPVASSPIPKLPTKREWVLRKHATSRVKRLIRNRNMESPLTLNGNILGVQNVVPAEWKQFEPNNSRNNNISSFNRKTTNTFKFSLQGFGIKYLPVIKAVANTKKIDPLLFPRLRLDIERESAIIKQPSRYRLNSTGGKAKKPRGLMQSKFSRVGTKFAQRPFKSSMESERGRTHADPPDFAREEITVQGSALNRRTQPPRRDRQPLRDKIIPRNKCRQLIPAGATCKSVSYTHLTLPTNREV
eukprot:TRINITY_DN3715_c0_g3_i1.p1 TRINITY_DN3715_c0_g3~~TRINITY_DN3715_c0_g3_i1.p1  ORF type:complete len:367 (-),score=70.22 TRINITY_DN3715_c0_g3_i1:47-1147(-)